MKRNGGGRDLGRGNGKGCSAVIGFDVCQEGNSFSLGLLRYPHISLLRPSDPVKISLFMWYSVAPPPPRWPTNWGPLCAIYSLGIRRHFWWAWYHISAGCVRIDHGREVGLDLDVGVKVWLSWRSCSHCSTNPDPDHHTRASLNGCFYAAHPNNALSFI